jgi:uncharacterized membrane protein
MARIAWLLGLGCVALLSISCGGDDDPEESPVDCSAPVPTYTQLQDDGVLSICTSCHTSQLSGAARTTAAGVTPEGVNFDTYDGAKSHAAMISKEVREGHMPPPNFPTDDHHEGLIVKWASCGTPQ